MFVFGTWACVGGPGERVDKHASSLDAMVSKAFDVDTAPQLAFTGFVSTAALTCADSGCFVAWQQCVSDYRYSPCILYGERLSPTGLTLDLQPIFLGRLNVDSASSDNAIIDVGTNNQGEFLVLWTDPDQTARFARISATDGTLLQGPAKAPGLGNIVSNGTSYVIVNQSGEFFVIGNGMPSALAKVAGVTGQLFEGITAIPGPANQYLFAWSDEINGHAARFDASTGTFLDTSGFIYSKHAAFTPKGVYAGGVYTLAWGALTMLRINSNGTVIDADDDFNNVSTAKSFALGTALPTTYGPQESYLFKKDDKAFYVWHDAATNGTRGLHGVHVDPANAALVAGDPIFSLGSKVQVPWTMALGANGGFVINTQIGTGAVPLSWTNAPFGLAAGAPLSFTMTGVPKKSPAMASDGTNYLVTWTAGSTLLGARMSPTGVLLDSQPFTIANGLTSERAVITFDGTDYLASWTDGSKIFGRKVHRDGSLGPAATTPFYTNATGISSLRGIFNGTYHWLAWREFSSLGQPYYQVSLTRIDPSSLTASAPVQSLIYDGSNFVLMGDTTPDAAHRTILVAVTDSDTNHITTIRSQRIRSESMLAQSEVTLENHLQNPPLLGETDGTTFMMTWETNQDVMRAALIDPVAGTSLTGFPKQLGKTGLEPLYVWHDGLSYMTLTDDLTVGARPPTMLRYDSTLAALDTSGTVLETQYEPTNLTYAAAHNAAGHSAVAYTAPDAQRFAVTIKVNFVSSDPTSPPPEGSGGSNGGGAPAGGATSAGGTPSATAGSDTGAVSGTAGLSAVGGAGGSVESDAGNGGVNDAGNGDSAGSSKGGSSSGGTSSASTAAGATSDAGQSNGAQSGSTGSGCGCRAAPSRSTNAWLVVALGILQVMRSRRRNRRHERGLQLAPI